MLNLSRDTTCDVEFGTYGNTCLANLSLMLREAGVDSSARSTNLATKYVGELVYEVEALL